MATQYFGNTAFTQCGPAKWRPDGWDLDRLIVPFDGPVTKLDAFLTSLQLWSPSPLNGNMYLSDYSTSDRKTYPMVELTYIGKRNGQLPPAKNRFGVGVQQANYNGQNGNVSVTLTYNAPTSTKIIWSRNIMLVGSVGAIVPASVQGIWFVAKVADRTQSFTVPTSVSQALAFFVQRGSSTGECEEVVPGKYYRVTQTKQNILFSVES